jgi:hypothetical protein
VDVEGTEPPVVVGEPGSVVDEFVVLVQVAHEVVGRLVVWPLAEVARCDDVGVPASEPAGEPGAEPAPRVCSSVTPPTTTSTRVVESVAVVSAGTSAGPAATSPCDESRVSTSSNATTAA